MSIQTKTYTQKKTGKVIKKYYANVYNPITKKTDVGPLQLKRSDAVKDEARILDEHKLLKLNADEANKARKRKGLTMSALYESWKPSAQERYANATYKVYTDYYDRYVSPVFDDQRVADLTAQTMKKYVDLLAEKYSAETVNKIINILSVLSRYCMENYGMELPLQSVHRKKVVAKPKTVWSAEQLKSFLDFAKTSHYYPMFLISAACGSRPGEVCGIAVEGYHPDLNGISLSRGYDKFGKLTAMKNTGSHRWLPIPDMVVRAIDAHVSWKDRMRIKHPGFADNDFLFVSEFGAPITPDVYSHSFKRVLARYNKDHPDDTLPDIPLYNCRHSFATNTLRGSTPATIREVASIMGNSPRVMMERYAQIIPEANAAVVNNYLTDICGTK